MIREGNIVLFPFPQTNLAGGSLRPALVVRKCPGSHDDWLICMISLQLRHEIPGIDEIIHISHGDFAQTGLKMTSLIRITRLAVVSKNMMQGAIGNLDTKRLAQIQIRIANWISNTP